MANYTTNYNLKKPLGSELYNVADQNGNMDIIDAAMKANADAIAKDEEGIAYRLGNTNTTGATLAVGTYVYVTGNTNGVSNGMYKVTTAIAANGSLTTSNLGSVPGGIGNALNSNLTQRIQTVTGTTSSGSALLAYPTGFSRDNCVIISAQFRQTVSYGDVWRPFGFGYSKDDVSAYSCFAFQRDTGINVRTEGNQVSNVAVRITLAKIS